MNIGKDDGIDFNKNTDDDEIVFENSNVPTEEHTIVDEEDDIDIYDKNDIDIDDI